MDKKTNPPEIQYSAIALDPNASKQKKQVLARFWKFEPGKAPKYTKVVQKTNGTIKPKNEAKK